MIKRICPGCKEEWYSSDSSTEIWICASCGAEISKDQVVEVDNKKKDSNE